MGTSRKAVLAEIENTLGIVPEWARTMPAEALPGFWSQMRDLQLGETAIPNKYKELIGLGVSGATRCRYCALFHTEAARLHGATDAEIREASMMAGFTMQASTYINALGVDYDEFKKELEKIVKYVRSQQAKAPQTRPAPHARA